MVALPRGLVDDIQRIDVDVRALTGNDEQFLAGRSGAPVAGTVTELLSRCVVSMGGAHAPVGDIRALSAGDREALLLHVRSATLGDRIDCVATCPDAACGERLDLTLSVDHLLLPPPLEEPLRWYDQTFTSVAAGEVRVVFRVPTGADQEAIASLASEDAGTAAASLLKRCIREASLPDDGKPLDLDELVRMDDVADAIAERMAELDPQAEIRLRFDCAACLRPVEVLFDTASFFLAEISAGSDRLDHEVHALAWHYHWSEREILRLSRPKRRCYLDLIAESVGPRQARGVA